MFKTEDINNLAKKLVELLPSDFKELPKDVEKKFCQTLKSTLHKMDLVTREELDAQKKVLQRTREKLEVLEAKLKEIELLHKTNK